ncbi:universal stress protein [Streptomyces sp. RPA4-5]|nr:universal stress protein [Streptomyces sp. RPA4-5]
MEHPLVVGIDGSDSAFRALEWAADEAALHGLPLRVVYASR